MGIEDWSTTPGNNNASPPNGWPEGMAPSDVNNCARQNMADIRTWYNDAQWTDLGNTPTYVSATSFTISGDVTSTYHLGRRIRCEDVGTYSYYGTITGSSYSAPNTTVTVALDSGSLTAGLDRVSTAILTRSNPSMPFQPRVVSITTDTTLDASHNGAAVFVNAGSGAVIITLPAASGNAGYLVRIGRTNSGSNTVTIDGNGSETINGFASLILRTQYEAVTLLCDGSAWQILAHVGRQVQVQTYTTGSGNFSVPADVRTLTEVYVTGGGGGGAGGTTTSAGGGGGAGGTAYDAVLAVTAGGTVAYAVGAAGSAGSNGSDSTFGALTGSGGTGATNSAGGAGGGTSGGDLGFAGNGGGSGTTADAGGAGHGGGSFWGGGARGVFGGSSGVAGSNYGAGGGGGSGNATTGASGSAGVIVFKFLGGQ